MNDRSLRQIVSSLGGVSNGFPREDGFDITVALGSDGGVLASPTNLADLEKRLGDMVVPTHARPARRDRPRPQASGAMTVLLRTPPYAESRFRYARRQPGLRACGPFANIAHGCNSVIATKAALKLADYVVTEAGFGLILARRNFRYQMPQGGSCAFRRGYRRNRALP